MVERTKYCTRLIPIIIYKIRSIDLSGRKRVERYPVIKEIADIFADILSKQFTANPVQDPAEELRILNYVSDLFHLTLKPSPLRKCHQ